MSIDIEQLLERNPETLSSSVSLFPDIEKQGIRFYAGKVRDNYYLPDGRMVMVATDRISTYDVVHPTGVPGKGTILTQLSDFWLNYLQEIVPTHLISAQRENLPQPFRDAHQLEGRTMLVEGLKIIPYECVVRGYITGSAWEEYKKTRSICGISLPEDMKQSQAFSDSIFTPATKEKSGHDQNISLEHMIKDLGENLAYQMMGISLAVYRTAADYALTKGVIIADTKFEFGLREDGELVLADEVLTPDSSRFWSAEGYEIGRTQMSLDKQFVRDYGTSIGWNKEAPAPELPKDVIAETRDRYIQVYNMLVN